jgi:hypothetical protein
LFGLTYDLWEEIIDEIALAHDSLFSAMHQTAEDLQITSALIEDLKSKKELKVSDDSWEFRLMIDLVEDEIDGFSLILAAIEQLGVLEQIKANVVSDHGFSLEDIEGFELEHGLDLQEEIFMEIEERYGIRAEVREDAVVYELVIFDSQDIDNSQYGEQVWQEDFDN